jgi:Ca2+-binding EF-hand superfamily protein
MSKKEIDDELKKNEIDPIKRTSIEFEWVQLAVAYRYNKGGKDDEARECFKLFDKRDKNYVTINDLKAVLPNYLEFQVAEVEIQELLNECDPNGTGSITFGDFK